MDAFIKVYPLKSLVWGCESPTRTTINLALPVNTYIKQTEIGQFKQRVDNGRTRENIFLVWASIIGTQEA